MEKKFNQPEINLWARKLIDLCKQQTIGIDTAIFLNSQVETLEEILDNPNSTEHQSEDAFKKLEQLNNRINTEIKYADEWKIRFIAVINLLRNT